MMATEKAKSIVVTGATATGKTHLAVMLAKCFDGEIISADSRQVYRGMDIGTGKDLNEYTVDGQEIPHHLLDIVDPGEEFNLHRFVKEAWKAYDEIVANGHLPIVCGGSPLYVKALLDGYNLEGGAPDEEFRKTAETMSTQELLDILRKEASPELYERTDKTQNRRIIRAIEIARTGSDVNDGRRLENPLIIVPQFPRALIHQRILERLDARIEQGMVAEIRHLHDDLGISYEKLDWFGLEYRFVAKYLTGELSYDDMHYQLLCHIRQFCKRQEIWFRRLEREGKVLHRIPEGNLEMAVELLTRS